MNILLLALGLVFILFVLLIRVNPGGVSLEILNPLLWWRASERNYRRNTIYSLTEPTEAVALLMTAVAKSDGVMSREQKNIINDVFQIEFQLDDSKSQALLAGSARLLNRLDLIYLDVAKVLLPSLEKFSTEQAVSTLQWMHDIAESEGQITPAARNVLNDAYIVFDQRFKLRLLYNT